MGAQGGDSKHRGPRVGFSFVGQREQQGGPVLCRGDGLAAAGRGAREALRAEQSGANKRLPSLSDTPLHAGPPSALSHPQNKAELIAASNLRAGRSLARASSVPTTHSPPLLPGPPGLPSAQALPHTPTTCPL